MSLHVTKIMQLAHITHYEEMKKIKQHIDTKQQQQQQQRRRR